MKSPFSLFSLCVAILLSFASCEQTATYEVPAIADEYISFIIDGQPLTLRSVPDQAYEPNRLFFQGDLNYLNLSRNSADQTTTFTILADNVPLVEKNGTVVLERTAFVPATITVLNTEMTGSVYCPHTVAGTGETIDYEGMIRVESITADGRIKGSFKTDPNVATNAVSITDGDFDLMLR